MTAKSPTPQGISALLRERWLPLPGWVGLYEVSDQGRVRSLRRKTRAGMRGGRPQGISALLKRAGFTRSQESGHYWRSSPGYIVRKDWATEGAVRVQYFNSSGASSQAYKDATLRKYTDAITAAGYHVQSGVHGDLIVTAPGE